MAEISWIKLKTTMFDDEKIRLIQSMPESDAILVIWIRLLVLAGKTNDNGLIYIQRNMPYSEEMLATLFGKGLTTVRLALETLRNFDMIDLNHEGTIAVLNWEKHQNLEGMEKVRIQTAERNRRYRERQKQLALENDSDVSVTSRDGTDIELELDKEEDKDTILYREIISYLNKQAGKNYNFKTESHRKLIRARWKEGNRLEQFEKVIDNKCADWLGSAEWEKYLRPATLFASKFDNYLNETIKNKKTVDDTDNTGVEF